MATIFTKIMDGEIPCHRVYEDASVFAFLDINPLSEGHVLLVPREEVATLGELSEESGAAVGRVLPRLCRAVASATGVSACNVLQNNGEAAGQVVPHVHFHIIPKVDGGRGGGLGVRWEAGSLDAESGSALASRISAAL